jgi:hypothetical protein
VDGYFVGTVEDFPGADGPLVEPGVRRVELRADGYQPHTFDVRVLPDAIVTHRMVLAKAGASPASGADTRRAAAAVAPGTPSAQATPKTFYVIPGCYAGDSRPRVEQLPAGCDPSAVRVIVPDRR